MTVTDRKAALRGELVVILRRDLAAAEKAHRSTLEGVTHEEAKPENDKDTRALEQSYLARGQALRAEEVKTGIAQVEAMATLGASSAKATLGALVTVSEGDDATTYWIAAYGGGAALSGGVQVVTPASPLGRALVGKTEGDEVEVRIGGKTRALEVTTIE